MFVYLTTRATTKLGIVTDIWTIVDMLYIDMQAWTDLLRQWHTLDTGLISLLDRKHDR